VGSRLPIIFGALLLARIAAAQPGPLPAADLAKQGVDLYNANNFAGAADMFKRALELEPNNNGYKFMLAQSLRKSNRCDQALPLYNAIAGTAPPDQKAEIDAGIAQCSPKIAPQPVAPPPPPPQPQVTVEPPAPSSGGDGGGGNATKGTALMLAGGGALIGAGIVLIWAAHTHSGDADAARSVADYNRISGRATTEYVLGAVGIAAGATLGALAFYRMFSKNESNTAVAFTPRDGGGTLVLERLW
jgi:tetratricopeptide (TPR) repeat protein